MFYTDHEILYRRDDGSFMLYNAKNASSKMLLSAENEVIINSLIRVKAN